MGENTRDNMGSISLLPSIIMHAVHVVRMDEYPCAVK